MHYGMFYMHRCEQSGEDTDICKTFHTAFFLTHGSVHHDSMLIKVQHDAAVCRHLFSVTSLYMFRVSCTHHQEY